MFHSLSYAQFESKLFQILCLYQIQIFSVLTICNNSASIICAFVPVPLSGLTPHTKPFIMILSVLYCHLAQKYQHLGRGISYDHITFIPYLPAIQTGF